MFFSDFFTNFTFKDYISSIVDILVLWYFIYKIFMLVRGTKAVQLINGIIVILIMRGLSEVLGLKTLSWLMKEIIDWGFLAIIIIFQPELRRALEQLGRGKIFSRARQKETEKQESMVDAITKACQYMAKRRIGALITIARETGLNDYIETGIQMNAKVSAELLINTFIPNTPLHDGAVIIQGDEIKAAACFLPLSESPFISKEFGTRHRAGIGISEVTDCLSVIVSEETGAISLASNGELIHDITADELRNILTRQLVKKVDEPGTNLWHKWVKKNG
jgi:conserved hypothetical protein TIGR00159